MVVHTYTHREDAHSYIISKSLENMKADDLNYTTSLRAASMGPDQIQRVTILHGPNATQAMRYWSV